MSVRAHRVALRLPVTGRAGPSRAAGAGRHGQRGQALVELTIVMTLSLFILLSLLDFGMAFNHHISLEYATREGARVGGALVNGGGTLGCGTGQSPNASKVDAYIVAAAQRVLQSNASPIVFADVGPITIYELNYNGTATGREDIWVPAPDSGPIVIDMNGDGAIDGADRLDFAQSTTGFPACSRSYASQPGQIGPTSIGVRITYTYRFQFGWASVVRFIDRASTLTQLRMNDRTVMAMNPVQ